ncbi:MAG: TlpA family protein disulfide reductase [Gemmataceae bacterium]|nr:TlpA family protein disulfide reductase [Gemmataceae bacterium]
MKKLSGKPFALIGVNVNGWDAKELKAVMDKDKLTWPSFVNGEEIVTRWNLQSTPTFYVIDHQGVIRHKWVGNSAGYEQGGLPAAEAIDAALDQLIQKAERSATK